MTKLILILSFLILTIQNETFTAKVIGVTDGDTIVVLTDDNKQIKIRLEGIDCPETKQDFGTKAKQTTVDLCFKKTVRVEQSGTDKYGRMLAFVFVGDTCINNQLIKEGMAWHYKQYNKDPELAKLEVEARKKKVGLWSHEDVIAPWDFRHR
jgi:endonuclease YncB( thermonuclease family)